MDLVVTSAGGVALYQNAPRRTPDCCSPTFSSVRGAEALRRFVFRHRQKDYGWKRWYPKKGGTLAQYEEALDGWHKTDERNHSARAVVSEDVIVIVLRDSCSPLSGGVINQRARSVSFHGPRRFCSFSTMARITPRQRQQDDWNEKLVGAESAGETN